MNQQPQVYKPAASHKYPSLWACRVRRARKQIDYSGNAYDNMMRAAIMRQGRNQLEEGGHRRAALPEDRSGCFRTSLCHSERLSYAGVAAPAML